MRPIISLMPATSRFTSKARGAERLPAAEGEQAMGELRGVAGALHGHLDRTDEPCGPFRSVAGLALEPAADHVEIAEDDGEQIVEVVRHAAGELADGLHLLRLDQARLRLDPPRRLGLELGGALADPLLELLVHVGERGHRRFELGLAFGERFFGELPLGDVDVDAAVAHRIAGLIADHPPAPEDPAGLPVARADDAIFQFLRVGAAFHRLAIAGNHPVSVVGVAEIARGRDRHGFVRRRQAHQAEELRRAAQHAGGKLDVPDADARRPLGETEGFVALAQLALHPGAFGDVAKEDGQAPTGSAAG